MFFLIPEGFEASSIEVKGHEIETMTNDRLMEVSFRSGQSGPIDWSISF
ncbi:MAG: hypothetical protein KC940_13700 [Candidatus Omnitrophica bacterium]|nr:hypothetical protein [Candidatus Omnitrophota bacterium]